MGKQNNLNTNETALENSHNFNLRKVFVCETATNKWSKENQTNRNEILQIIYKDKEDKWMTILFQ